jgi:hypothetical protein
VQIRRADAFRGATSRRLAAAVGLAALILIHTACVMPVRVSPAVEGTVVDQVTGAPLAEALVVVRFDGRYDDVLPDRDLLGHLEARTDSQGRFHVGPFRRSGLSVWPLLRTEARVVAVLREGYRCARPRQVSRATPVEIRLAPALDQIDRRESCRPVAARSGEAKAYMAAWRALFPGPAAEPSEGEREMARVLAARAALGFGENCQGPVLDLALAPGGGRAALLVADPAGAEVQVVELARSGARTSEFAAREPQTPPRRLAWTSPTELVLWEPASEADRDASPSIFASRRFEVIWTAAGAQLPPPAAPAFGGRPPAPAAPLDPGDLNDEGDALWLGRSFALVRSPNPETGLAADRLRITQRDGTHYQIELPGEACGPAGRFGRPHYRMAAGGELGLDLRFIEGGCHAVAIDLATGTSSKLDGAAEPAICRDQRRIPAAHLGAALRGYSRELEAALAAVGADPAAAYALEIAPNGAVRVKARDFAGQTRILRGPRFPVATPLRRIDVSVVGRASRPPRGAPIAVPAPEPL